MRLNGDSDFAVFFLLSSFIIVAVGWLAEWNLSGRYFFIGDEDKEKKKTKKKMRSFTNFSVVINNEEMRDFDLIVCLPLGPASEPQRKMKTRIILMLVKRRLYYINGLHVYRAISLKRHIVFCLSLCNQLGRYRFGAQQRPEQQEGFQDSFVKIWKVILEFLIRLIKNSWIIFPETRADVFCKQLQHETNLWHKFSVKLLSAKMF